MIRGIYNSASGMITQKKKLDVVTNNLANTTTAGYKEDKLLTSSFSEMYVAKLDNKNTVQSPSIIGSKSFGVHIDEVVTSFLHGNFEETGIYTDFALQGDGFFVVDTPQGMMYSKSGNFKVSADGILVTNSGYPVMSDSGYIQTGFEKFSSSEDGYIETENGRYKMMIVDIEDKSLLRKQNDGLYAQSETLHLEAQNTKLRQGFLESSNVDLVKQMVEMIEISRNFEINQRMVKIQDERLGKSVNEIGRI